MTEQPLLSIITVTRNAADTLPPTLASIAGQDCGENACEYILIDGASTDNTVELAMQAPLKISRRIVSEPDRGLYDAMNKGLGLAKGEYVMFLNAGDTLHSTRIVSEIVAAAEAYSRPGIIYGQTQIVDASRHRIADRHLTAPDHLTLNSFKQGMMVCHQAFVALRKITSNFDTSYRFSADYDWCIRCLQHSRKNVLLPGIMIDYLNEGVTTANHRKSLIERFRIMCHYYGTIPTVLRHVKFFVRNIHRKFTDK